MAHFESVCPTLRLRSSTSWCGRRGLLPDDAPCGFEEYISPSATPSKCHPMPCSTSATRPCYWRTPHVSAGGVRRPPASPGPASATLGSPRCGSAAVCRRTVGWATLRGPPPTARPPIATGGSHRAGALCQVTGKKAEQTSGATTGQAGSMALRAEWRQSWSAIGRAKRKTAKLGVREASRLRERRPLVGSRIQFADAAFTRPT